MRGSTSFHRATPGEALFHPGAGLAESGEVDRGVEVPVEDQARRVRHIVVRSLRASLDFRLPHAEHVFDDGYHLSASTKADPYQGSCRLSIRRISASAASAKAGSARACGHRLDTHPERVQCLHRDHLVLLREPGGGLVQRIPEHVHGMRISLADPHLGATPPLRGLLLASSGMVS